MLTIIDVQTELQKQKNSRISFSEIGVALGTSRANISKRAKQNSFLKEEEIKKIETFFNTKLTVIQQIANNSIIEIPYWHNLPEETKEKYRLLQKETDEKNEKCRRQSEQENQRQLNEEKKYNEWRKLPLQEQFSRDNAVKMVWNVRFFPKALNSGLIADLIKIYNLNTSKIIEMTAEEITLFSDK